MEIDIINKIKNSFGVESEQAIEILDSFEKTQNLSPRVTRCIVVLADGRLDELKKRIDEAKIDWRDIIDQAEEEPFQYKTPFLIN